MHNEVTQLFDLTGQVAFVTGGARNLGLDAAAILAAAGADVAISSRTLETAEESAEQLKDTYGVDTLALALDQTDFDQVAAAADQVHGWKSKVDILVNNAGGGLGEKALLFERDPRDIAKLIELNLTGSLFCCREIGRFMADRRQGKIINIASIAGMLARDRRMYERCGMAGQPIDYAAAKAGVIGMTRDLAGFLSPMGVYVNTISPGGFFREGNLDETFNKEYSDRTPQGRMGRDGIDMKGAILFLSSSASDYVTGVNLPVDGGFSIWH